MVVVEDAAVAEAGVVVVAAALAEGVEFAAVSLYLVVGSDDYSEAAEYSAAVVVVVV